MNNTAYMVRSSDSNPLAIWASQVPMYRHNGLRASREEAEVDLERAHMVIRYNIFEDMLNHYFHGEKFELDEYGDQEVQEVSIIDNFYN